MVVMLFCCGLVTLVRRGTTGRFLEAMRGSETGAAGLGINLTAQHIAIFALSGLVAGIGGILQAVQQQQVTPGLYNYQVSLAYVVIVVTTGAVTIEGALQAGFGFVVLQQLLTYLPQRLGGNSLVVVLFAFGALTYAAHPEGILEYQKRRWNQRVERYVFRSSGPPPGTAATAPGLATAGEPGAYMAARVDGAGTDR
jgi:ABC-type branched-subunit amino acid transport system permease subunit